MNVHSDLIGEKVTITNEGLVAERTFVVDQIDAAPTSVAFTAMTAAEIPQYGQPHPTIPNIRCSQVAATALSPTQANVVASYKVFQPGKDDPPAEISQPQIEVGAVVNEKETNKDIDGEDIVTSHRYNEGQPNEKLVVQAGLVKLQVPSLYLRYSRRELLPPDDLASLYVGLVNSTSWRGNPPRSWLCARIEGRSTNGGQSYEVSYEFQHNQDLWEARVVFIDPDTKEPFANSQPGIEIGLYQVYQEADFNDLNLVGV